MAKAASKKPEPSGAPEASPKPAKAAAKSARTPASADRAPTGDEAATTPAGKAPAKVATSTKATSTRAKAAEGGTGTGTGTGTKKASSTFPEKFLEARRKQLLDERSNLLGSADRLTAEAASLMEDQDPGDVQFDDESGEGDSLAVERERDLALSAQAREMITAIDAALARLGDGSYGLSLVSGKPIPKERLEAIPWATELVEEKVGGLGLRR